MKRIALAATLIGAALLSGCIIIPPHRHGGHGGHGHHYQGSTVNGQPGPR